MKYLILMVGLLSACASSRYAYSGVMTKQECESECAARGYGILGLTEDKGQVGCMCDGKCKRPKHRGGCEPLAPPPGSSGSWSPTNQM